MDTEGNFRPERVEAIAERFGLDPTETLENIIVTRVFNHEQQIERAHVSAELRTDRTTVPHLQLLLNS